MLVGVKAGRDYPLLMSNKNRKLKKKDYLQLFKEKNKIVSGGFVFFFKRSNFLVVKTAARKSIGKAHVRNYRKRRLRNILIDMNFKEKLLILGIIVKNEDISFRDEKNKIQNCLKPIII